MAIDDQTSSRLEYLIQQLLDNKLTGEERAQLESLLAAHDYLESQFVHEIEVESALRNLNASFDVSDRVMQRIRTHLADAEARRARTSGGTSWRNTAASATRHPWRIAGAFALLAAVAVAGFWMFGRRAPAGTMTIHEGIEAGRDAQTLVTPGGPVSLNGGSHVALARNQNASILCRNGTDLQLGLEADMTFIGAAASEDGGHVRLAGGRLHARIPALPAGETFTIDTPHGKVTASAAEVEIFVSTMATEVRVDAGLAHVERTTDHKSLDLGKANYAVVRDGLDPAPRPTLPLRCLFDDQIDPAAFWTSEAGRNAILPQSSHTGTSSLRFTPQQGRVSLAGLALPVREHPRSGEYRFVTFAWRKDGGGRIALQFDHADESQDCHKQGRLHGYRFDAGDGAPVDGLALRTDGKAPQAWWTLTRDLWHDFGDFTVTGLTFICPDGDAAQFDSVYLGQSPADFANIIMVARDTAAQPSPIMARQSKSRE